MNVTQQANILDEINAKNDLKGGLCHNWFYKVGNIMGYDITSTSLKVIRTTTVKKKKF